MAGGNAIASGSVILTANADGLKTGLDSAAKDVDGWGKSVSNKLGKDKSGFLDKASKLLGGAGNFAGSLGGAGAANMLSNMAGLASHAGKLGPVGIAIGAVGAAAGVAAVGLKAASDTLDDLAKQGAMAQSLGLTAEQFTGIAGVAKSAGEDTKEFIESLVTMGKLGTDAAAGTEEASKAMKAMGLNANDFIKLRADEQFFAVFESLQKMEDPLQRTRALMQAFGEDGGKLLLPLLSKTPDQLKAMAKGFAVTGEEMQKATAASQAVKGMDAAIDKLWRGIAIGAAPIIEKLANGVTALEPAFKWVASAAETFGAGLSVGLEMAGENLTFIVESVQEMLGGFGALGVEFPTVRDVIVAGLKACAYYGAYMWDTWKAGAGAGAVVIGKIIGYVGDLADNFKGAFKTLSDMGADAAAALGMTDTEATFRKIGAAANGIGASLRGGGDAMDKWGREAMAGWGKTAERFDAKLNAALNPMKAKDAGMEIGKAVAEGMSAEPIKLAGALTKGSKEAYSMVVKNSLRGIQQEKGDPIKNLVQEAKKGNGHHKKANQNLDAIKAKLEKLEAV